VSIKKFVIKISESVPLGYPNINKIGKKLSLSAFGVEGNTVAVNTKKPLYINPEISLSNLDILSFVKL
jgi:hypothetical protein